MGRYKFVFLLVLSAIVLSVQSQTILRGKVTNGTTPIEAVSIHWEGKATGVFSNAKGDFALRVGNTFGRDEIIFSHINYKKRTISIDSLRLLKGIIVLEGLEQALGEVSVISPTAKTKWEKSGSLLLGETYGAVNNNLKVRH